MKKPPDTHNTVRQIETRSTTNILALFVMVLYLSGCAVGRSWDTPDISDFETLPGINERITIYTPEYASLIESALRDSAMSQAGSVTIKEINAGDIILYPRLTVTIEDTVYDDTLIYLNRLSFFTFSLIPGYFSES